MGKTRTHTLRFPPGVKVTLTKRRLYCILFSGGRVSCCPTAVETRGSRGGLEGWISGGILLHRFCSPTFIQL